MHDLGAKASARPVASRNLKLKSQWQRDAQEKLGKCLVIGGAGWLGTFLVQELLDLDDDLGISVVVLDLASLSS